VPGPVEVVPKDLVSGGRILAVDRRERKPDDVRRLLPRRLVDDRAVGVDRELPGVGGGTGLEFGRVVVLLRRPVAELVGVFAVLVVLEDLGRQQILRVPPAVLVDHLTGLEVGGARGGGDRGDRDREQRPSEFTHGRMSSRWAHGAGRPKEPTILVAMARRGARVRARRRSRDRGSGALGDRATDQRPEFIDWAMTAKPVVAA